MTHEQEANLLIAAIQLTQYLDLIDREREAIKILNRVYQLTGITPISNTN